jgi:hypothetical protein
MKTAGTDDCDGLLVHSAVSVCGEPCSITAQTNGSAQATNSVAVAYTFLITFPACKQDVQTRMRFGVPFTSARTFCKLGSQRRFVTLWAWDML